MPVDCQPTRMLHACANFLEPYFISQHFLYQKMYRVYIFLTLIFLTFIFCTIFFLDQKFYANQHIFLPIIFFDLEFCGTLFSCGPQFFWKKVCLDLNLLDLKFLEPNIFSIWKFIDSKFVRPKNFLTQTLFSPTIIIVPWKNFGLLLKNFFGTNNQFFYLEFIKPSCEGLEILWMWGEG